MTRQRGRVQVQASILHALEDGALYHTQLRDKTGIKGSTIYFHINKLLEQQLITTWQEPYNPIVDKKFYELTDKGRKALGYIQLTFDMLGLPDLRVK